MNSAQVKNGQCQDAYEEKRNNRRFALSVIVIAISTFFLIFAICAKCFGADSKTSEIVFTAIVGLVGTWMGTILAFYYTKDNFDAAAKNTQALVDRMTTSEDKLRSTKANEVMLKRNEFTSFVFDETIKLTDLLTKYFGKNERLPILAKSDTPVYIPHKSTVNAYRADATNKDATLKDMLAVREYLEKVKALVTVRSDDDLGFVKRLMEQKSVGLEAKCSDAFVTVDGTPNSAVIGWITNVIISEHSQV